MAKERCYKCGKSKELADGILCKSCLNNKEPFIKQIRYNRLLRCVGCGAYSYNKEWFKDRRNSESVIKDTIKKGLKINPYYTLKSSNIKLEPVENESTDEKKVYMAHVMLRLASEKTFDFTKKIRFILKDSICQVCQKHMSEYFEGIIQLRGTDNENFGEAKEMLFGLIEKKKNVEVSKISENKNGIDIYVTNKRTMQEVSQQIFEKFGGKFEHHSQLFSHNPQTSKNIYRLNTLLRLPDFNRHDIIKIDNNILIVEKVHGKKVHGLNIKNNKKQQYDFNNKDYEIIERKENLIKKTTVSKVYPELEVLNQDYESVPAVDITEKKKEYFVGKEIKIIDYMNRCFIYK